MAAFPEDSVADPKPYFYVPDEQVEEYIKIAELTPAKAKKYRNTVKLLELADKGLRTADIAKELDISMKEVQALRKNSCQYT